jgi:hypothetical protein
MARSGRGGWKLGALALTLAGLSAACGGSAESSDGTPADSAGTGSSHAGSSAASGGSSGSSGTEKNGGASGSGGEEPAGSCKILRDDAPGAPAYQLAQAGYGVCDGVTLGDIIDRIHADHPELADIQALYAPDPERGGDGSFIYAFQREDGTFALVFKRGGGDCPAGCTENDYWYFDTVDQCVVKDAGYTRRYFDGQCLPADQLPMWGIPPAAPPESICDANNDAQDVSGDYSVSMCGQATACATAKDGARPMALPGLLRLHVAQDPDDLAHGTVTLNGTGDPWLDDRELPADFQRRRFHVELHADNLPAMCIEQEDVTLDYDFEGFRQGHLSFFQTATPDCTNDPGDYCKGGIEADLGREVLGPVGR